MRQGTVYLTLTTKDGTIVWGPTTYNSPSTIDLSLTGLLAGTYKLIVVQNTETEAYDIDVEGASEE